MIRSRQRKTTLVEVLALAVAVSMTAATAVRPVETGRALLVAQAAEKAAGEGVIKGVDLGERKLRIAHRPIAALNWPEMTMAFGVAPGVDLSGLTPGAKVKFALSRDAKGLYVIEEIHKAE